MAKGLYLPMKIDRWGKEVNSGYKQWKISTELFAKGILRFLKKLHKYQKSVLMIYMVKFYNKLQRLWFQALILQIYFLKRSITQLNECSKNSCSFYWVQDKIMTLISLYSYSVSGLLLNPIFFFFLVLPLYCYQPISLHPHAHMLSCNPMDFSPPGSSVHGLFRARILEWVAISFSSCWFFILSIF